MIMKDWFPHLIPIYILLSAYSVFAIIRTFREVINNKPKH